MDLSVIQRPLSTNPLGRNHCEDARVASECREYLYSMSNVLFPGLFIVIFRIKFYLNLSRRHQVCLTLFVICILDNSKVCCCLISVRWVT